MKEQESWHLSRSVNVAHILVVVTLFISGFVYVSNIKEDVALHDLDISGQPSGTAICYKITTHNQSGSKSTKIHATSLAWA